jgi:hypothetical protein
MCHNKGTLETSLKVNCNFVATVDTKLKNHTHTHTRLHKFVFYKQNIHRNKKKEKPKMHEKQNVIDDLPLDIVELLAIN